MLYPHSVAVIGASRNPDAVGAAVVRNLLASGFPGPIYPVNPSATTIQSLAAYPGVEAIPQTVDLAIIAVPAARVVEVAEQCGRKGVRALVVLTAGFAEVGAEGQHRQTELLRVCRGYGMRLIGPNCIGVINTDPALTAERDVWTADATGQGGSAWPPRAAPLGLAAIDFTAARGLGFSSVVSMGNKADISGNDLLGYWHTDPRTDVILLYLESFGNPRKFARLARAIGRSKPIVALKSGRSAVGARATASHTGALLRRVRRDGGRAVPPGGRDPHRHARRDAGRRRAAGPPAAARWAPSRDRDQCRRAGGHVRRHLRGARPGGPCAVRGDAGRLREILPGRSEPHESGRHAGSGNT